MSRSFSSDFGKHVRERNVPAARAACALVVALMPTGFLLDAVTEPTHTAEFFRLRVGASCISLGLLGLTYTRWGQRHAFWLGAAPAFTAAAAISLMTDRLGGPASPYYAGLSLCILGVGLVFHWTARQAALVCSIIMGIWLVPVFGSVQHSDVPSLFNNLYFLGATAIIAVASNAIRFRLARREFEARAQLGLTTDELRDALGRLQRLDQVKSRFFANVSHELRTPLTLILAPVEDLLGRPLEDGERRSLQVVRSNAARLLRLIDELLDLSRVDAGGLRLNVGSVDLRALAEAIRDNSLPLAEAKAIRLTLEAPKPVEDVHGDAHRIESILSNLVGNALKYTPERGRIQLRLLDEPEGAAVEVEDDGPGISPEDLPHVFERFFQASSEERRRQGGVGLGLALAKELAELHDGKLTVTSQLGTGTTFRFWLPKGQAHFSPEVIERRSSYRPSVPVGRRAEDPVLSAVDESPVPPEAAESSGSRQTGSRILIVEDRDELRAFIVSLLSEHYVVFEAGDAEQGLAIARDVQPDLVLSDVMMPGASGTDLCSYLKRDARLRNIPVILLTARVGSEATLEAYSQGADDFVAKPFHPRVLLARVRAQLRLRQLALQLASQEKLAAIGTLVAGVAHEVKNPLNSLINAASVLRERDFEPKTSARLLGIIGEGAERIHSIVTALDAHARPAEAGGVVPLDLREGIEATLRLLEYRAGEVTIETTYRTTRLAVAPAGPINQIFLNLVDNALRAGARRISIVVSEEPGEIVTRVSDDGAGVAIGHAERIFDPFFTTRPPGEGTGLGLYLSRRIAEEHGGSLRLVARHGAGAEFELRLRDADAAHVANIVAGPGAPNGWSGSRTPEVA